MIVIADTTPINYLIFSALWGGPVPARRGCCAESLRSHPQSNWPESAESRTASKDPPQPFLRLRRVDRTVLEAQRQALAGAGSTRPSRALPTILPVQVGSPATGALRL